ncbi:hypothetical protein RRG08_041311 [Elysia crispata]|uniref:Uncharacterized protein n=1 Tax=Elysia crispata TaxID=231223 RepID=A0AAE1DM06_9GAST|nr:hypothetical protein RRG08_041311 [Elysia crispata]
MSTEYASKNLAACDETSEDCEKKTAKVSSKRMSCDAFINVFVKRKVKCNTRSKDIHIQDWLTRVSLLWGHSHPLEDPAVLKFRDVRPTTQQRLVEFFCQGYHVNTAHALLMYELKLSDLEHPLAAMDRAIIPDLEYVRRSHDNFLKKKLRLNENSSAPSFLDEALARIKSCAVDEGVKTEAMIVEGELVIALTTPIMERVHLLAPQSAQFVFVDLTDMMEVHQCVIQLLVTHSPTGALPLGCLISTSDSAKCTEQDLRLLLKIHPEGAFFGCGEDGSAIFLTMDRS